MTASSENIPGETRQNLRDRIRHAFAVGDEYAQKLEADELALLDEIAGNIHRRGLTVAAIPFLMFNKPLNVLGANFLQMGEMVLTLHSVEQYLRNFIGPSYSHELLVRTLEKRITFDHLVDILEAKLEK